MIAKTLTVVSAGIIPTGIVAASDVVINEGTLLPLGIVILCTVAIVGGTWRAANEFRNITGGLKHLREETEELAKRVGNIEANCPDCNGNGKRKH